MNSHHKAIIGILFSQYILFCIYDRSNKIDQLLKINFGHKDIWRKMYLIIDMQQECTLQYNIIAFSTNRAIYIEDCEVPVVVVAQW